ncbi:hypothetical protein BGX23_008843 [Mortierella sp. AD031]|nr:hypothetical protein BGX23_008843 [Mortierella sp. AD031]KAG0210706.1 hypothetical protein BGX33_004763 [Mortierella sp. NVP41]
MTFSGQASPTPESRTPTPSSTIDNDKLNELQQELIAIKEQAIGIAGVCTERGSAEITISTKLRQSRTITSATSSTTSSRNTICQDADTPCQ